MRPTRTPYACNVRLFHILAICAGLTALTLGGCSGKIYPFAKGRKARVHNAALAPPPLYLAALQGTPHNVSVKLMNHLVREAQQRNLTFASKETYKTVRITGQFSTAQTKSGAAITYVWNITNYISGKRHKITGKNLVSGHRQAAAWLGADDAMLEQIARKTLEDISRWYTRSGYRLQHATLLPPELARMAPRSRVRTIPVPVLPAQTAQLKTRKPVAIDPRAQQGAYQTATSALHTASLGKAPRGHTNQNQVAISPVHGASAQANRIFMQALQKQLAKAGFAVTELPEQNVPSITGTVKPGARQGTRQQVSLIWHVYDTRGIRIGTVIQKNYIPGRSFSGTWAGHARLAANAAAPGIVKLLSQNH